MRFESSLVDLAVCLAVRWDGSSPGQGKLIGFSSSNRATPEKTLCMASQRLVACINLAFAKTALAAGCVYKHLL